jgi:hypothetical protein
MLVVQPSYRTRGAYYETVHVFVSLALDTDFKFEAALPRFIYLRCMVSICSFIFARPLQAPVGVMGCVNAIG